jgi:hypothetical protein
MSEGRAALRRRPEAALFALALGTYAYFFQGGGWNANVRFDLVRAIVEQHTLRIDGYETNTGDLAFRDGHYYCDKAPGLSLLAVPVYAALHTFAGEGRLRGRFVSRAAWLCTVWAVALPSAAAAVMICALAARLGLAPRCRAALSLAYAFGTLAFPYSTLFYGHQLASALLIAAFGLLALARGRDGGPGPVRLAASGLLLGCASAVEYPSLLAAVVIGSYAATITRPRRRWWWLAGAAAAPLVALMAYHHIAFGGAFTLPYAFSTDTPRHRGAFFGVGWPTRKSLYGILVSPYRGLFYSAPWLALAGPGAVRLLRASSTRTEAMVCLTVAALNVALNASLTDWPGGWAAGPRHLVPALPFLTLLAAGVAVGRRVSAPEALVYGAAAALSVTLMLVATSVQPEVPRWYGRPFEEFLWPSFRAGQLAVNTLPIHTGTVHPRRQAWNVGELLGLEGRTSLLPLAAFAAAALWWLFRAPETGPSRVR